MQRDFSVGYWRSADPYTTCWADHPLTPAALGDAVHTQTTAIQLVLDTALTRSAKDLALLLEDSLRMHLIEALLDEHCTVRVGAHATDTDRILSRASPNAAVWETVSRATRSGRFLDIYVEHPKTVIELKVFGEVGPKDYPDKPGCVLDLEKLLLGTADAAIIVASEACYKQLQRSTGRYPFTTVYPRPLDIGTVFSDHTGLSWQETALVARAAKTTVHLNDKTADRFVVCMRKR
ncbi:MAG: hypothetical protein ABI627_06500 [Polyangiaceae bacterium]